MNKFRLFWLRSAAALRLTRPGNLIIMACGVLVGGLMGSGSFAQLAFFPRLFWGIITVVLIGAGGNSLNDAVDASIDKVNRPNRPLPSGDLSLTTARYVWGMTTLSGVLISWYLSTFLFLFTAVIALILFAYNIYLQRVPVVGNVTVSALVASVFLFGGALIDAQMSALPGAIIAFLITFSREIVKDVEDIEGDTKSEIKTLPVIFGPRLSSKIVAILLVLSVLSNIFFYVKWQYSTWFLVISLMTAILLLRTAVQLWRPENLNYGSISAQIKLIMLVEMLALAHI